MIRLVAVDFDGTLLRSDGTIGPATVAAVRAVVAAGIPVVPATTRNLNSIVPYYEQMQLAGPIIATNGAHVLAGPAGPDLAYHTISLPAARRLLAVADANDWELSTTVGECTYFRQRPGQALGAVDDYHTVAASNSAALNGSAVGPSRILAHMPPSILALRDLCAGELNGSVQANIFYRQDGTPRSLLLYHPAGNKRQGLQTVLDYLGLAAENVLAIGDNENDLALLSAAGHRAAVGNAIPELKAMADFVGPSNNEDGVAAILRHFIN